MNLHQLLCLSFLSLCFAELFAQSRTLEGYVLGEDNLPVTAAHIFLRSAPQKGVQTNKEGYYYLPIPNSVTSDTLLIYIRHISHLSVVEHVYFPPDQTLLQHIFFIEIEAHELDSLTVSAKKSSAEDPIKNEAVIQGKDLEQFPAISSDVSQALGTLAGVVANRGLSNAYAVRGGNYHENLVYVEDMPIYVPYLTRTGQQEGLTLANTALTKQLFFSAGGWEARYGDKLSSMLNVYYRDPQATKVGMHMSLLGTEAHLGVKHPSKPLRLLVGMRYKDTGSLLKNLDVQGDYRPRFFDVQSLVRWTLPRKIRKTSELTLLTAYAQNRYFLRPSTQRSTFGNIERQLGFFIHFLGEEQLLHDITHVGMKWSYGFGGGHTLNLINSWSHAFEREYFDLWSAFRVCDIVGTGTLNDCEIEVGTVAQFNYGRNFLRALNSFSQTLIDFYLSEGQSIYAALFLQSESIQDVLYEYSFSDTAGQTTPLFSIDTRTTINRYIYGGALQYNFTNLDQTRALNLGLRVNYVSNSQEWLWQPRAQFSFRPGQDAPVLIKFTAGLYAQPPTYREIRDINGVLNLGLRAPYAVHLLGSIAYDFKIWDRDFTLFTDVYYKILPKTVPYEQANIRIRYYNSQPSSGYAYGIDTRLYGFFVPNTESWVSVSLLKTAENITYDGHSFIRRPTDQRLTLAVFLQDYLPNLPTWQAYTKMLFGSGSPFNPTGELHFRNVFTGEAYYQLDLGFSKTFNLTASKRKTEPFTHHLTTTLEALNLLGGTQNISYNWISTDQDQQFAVPNDFSMRFFNLKLGVNF